MAEPATPEQPVVPVAASEAKGFGWRKYALGLPLGLVAAAGGLLLGLDTPIGHRLIADALADTEMANGLRISVARIEGSIYGRARLEGLVLRDPQGVFLRAPEATLDWRPLKWFPKGLVIREAVVKRGTLQRAPHLRPGDPNASLWPSFDIAIDRFAIERMTVSKSLLGAERKIDLSGQFKLASGEAKLVLDGKLGGGDRLAALFDAHRAQNRFALKVDYDAPKGGLLAALTGSPVARRLNVDGKGTWDKWQGWLLGEQGGKRAARLQLTQAAGTWALAGKLWGDPLFSPDTRRMLGGPDVAVLGKGTLADKVLRGDVRLVAAHVRGTATGGVDLGKSRFDALQVALKGGPRLAVSEGDTFADLALKATLDGPFATSALQFSAHAARWISGDTSFEGLSAQGSATRKDGQWLAPTKLATDRIVTNGGDFDAQLRPVRASATLRIKGSHIDSDDLALAIPLGSAQASMRIDTAKGTYVFAGRAALQNWPTTLGAAALQGPVVVTYLRGVPWRVKVDAQGVIANPAGAALAHVAGGPVRFSGHVEVGKDHFLTIAGGKADAPALSLAFDGARGGDGRIALHAKGQQRRYGAFSGQLSLGDGGPRGSFHLPDPYPALGIRDVDIGFVPEAQALRIDASGQSMLGPFEGALGLEVPPDGAPETAKTRLTVRGLDLSDTYVSGALDLGRDGALGQLTLGGGGVSGTIALAPRAGGQGAEANLSALNAHFQGDKPLTIALGRMKLSGLFEKNHTTLSGDLSAQGVGKGKLFIGSLAMAARLTDGTGKVTAAIGGRRGSRFDLQATADVAPGRIALLAGGNYAGQRIAMPRRALFTADLRADGSTADWRLAPAQVDFGGGRAVAQGVIGNGSLELGLGLADMPLSLGDILFPDLGFGGRASGQLSYMQQREALPTGEAKLMVKGLTRSGMVLMSRPVDVALVAKLGTQALDLRAVAAEGGQARGRLQARIDRLAQQGLIADRLRAGHLMGQLRYGGPADALWRLMALETLDLTGQIEIAADMAGTLEDPEIRGSLAGDALRLQSAASGMDITAIHARGAFAGSTLSLTSLSGSAGGGQVSGTGNINFAGMEGGRGPSIDITIAARKAQLLSRPDMAITVTGPIRVLSDGTVGTIAGRLGIDKARWRLGQANSVSDLPNLPVREINRRSDLAPASEKNMPWRLMVDASGGGIRVQGLGMDSQWNADLKLRGALLEPAISGAANLVEGSYDFASKHFDLARGRISFDGNSPPDPRLDIAANASVSGLSATISVRGTANKPEIAFSSVPSLPEEELLSRILFGDSITQISAPEAVQLGAALAALHGGGGLDPINKLRSAVGLDRLRFVSADAALGRQQGVAVGKYLHRHIYVELVTDGRGYSATNLEFRLTSWLALLGTVASNERQSINARLSKDY